MLAELLGSFAPAPDVETVEVGGELRPFRELLHEAVRDLELDFDLD